MNPKVVAELERLARLHRGKLMPEDVVKAAKNPKNPLHSRFEWSDSKAAHAWRLWQARQLIVRVTMIITPAGTDEQMIVQTWTSLSGDRNAKGGYRELAVVLRDADLRTDLLETAKAELRVFQVKYRMLKELVGVFKEIDKVV